MTKKNGGKFYAVHAGRRTGVFATWEECEAQVKGYVGAKFKRFKTAAEADAFVSGSVILPSEPASAPDGLPKIVDEGDWEVVYCDGACKGNGKEGSVAGIGVWWGKDDHRNLAERCPGAQTNNRAELVAIVRILETTPYTKKPLLIKTDSEYSINCFKLWLPKWRSNNFKASSGELVKNLPLILYLDALLDERARAGQKVHLQHVRGHVGVEGNECADVLAGEGATMGEVEERDWAALERMVRARDPLQDIEEAAEPKDEDAGVSHPDDGEEAAELKDEDAGVSHPDDREEAAEPMDEDAGVSHPNDREEAAEPKDEDEDAGVSHSDDDMELPVDVSPKQVVMTEVPIVEDTEFDICADFLVDDEEFARQWAKQCLLDDAEAANKVTQTAI